MDQPIEIRDVVKDKITYRVNVFPDPDATPYEADCYTAEDIAAWKRDDWRYVIVDVTPVIDGQEIEAASDSLGAVEYGTLANGRDIYMNEICNVHPVPDMIPEALTKLRNVAPRLIKALGDTL